MKLTLILSSMFLACSIHAQTVQQLQSEITQLKQLQGEVTQLKAQVASLQNSPIQSIAPSGKSRSV
jgi:cell division protein FtsB